eukprot:3617508-Rhodomonas_salina.2
MKLSHAVSPISSSSSCKTHTCQMLGGRSTGNGGKLPPFRSTPANHPRILVRLLANTCQVCCREVR